jgi:iron(II)-dependent oxidoreductase
LELVVVQALSEARERTLALVAGVSEEDLERVHSPLMSPLAWDLGHIAAFEDLWLVHRYGGRPLLRAELARVYDAMETPRSERGELPFLTSDAVREYLEEVRGRTLEVIGQRGVGDGLLHEMVLRHEHQHNETMLQTLELARIDGCALEPASPVQRSAAANHTGLEPAEVAADHTGLELVEVAGGPCTVGAPADGFAYDNERPRHRVHVRRFLIGRTPITNGAYRAFVEDGGYRRRAWWSEEGWAWRERHGITRPAGWTPDLTGEWRLGRLQPLHPERPVVHVSWFEAEAFARAHEARLPSEQEWEKAAAWDPQRRQARRWPWGEEPPLPGVHANLDHIELDTTAVGAHPCGVSPWGCLDMIGNVWEWTASEFDGYPRFSPHPYREYSAPFFRAGYRVLRGGSWATRARVATPTFRNWDHPERRQIFAGIRIVRDP